MSSGRMTHNTVYPSEPDNASVLEGDVSSKSDRERLKESFPDSPLYTGYDPLVAFGLTVINSDVVNPDESRAQLGYWGLEGHVRNYANGVYGAPKTIELFPDGNESMGIGTSFTPSVKSPSSPGGSPSLAAPTSETRAPFVGPSSDDSDAQPYKSSIDIRSRVKELVESRESIDSPSIVSLETLVEG